MAHAKSPKTLDPNALALGYRIYATAALQSGLCPKDADDVATEMVEIELDRQREYKDRAFVTNFRFSFQQICREAKRARQASFHRELPSGTFSFDTSQVVDPFTGFGEAPITSMHYEPGFELEDHVDSEICNAVQEIASQFFTLLDDAISLPEDRSSGLAYRVVVNLGPIANLERSAA
jgi:hypothetical protein